MECRVCIDWQASSDILGSTRSEESVKNYVAIIKDAAGRNVIVTDQLVVIKTKKDPFKIATQVLAKIAELNSHRLVRIPLKGCVVCPNELAIRYRSVLNLFKTYSSTPTIANVVDEAAGTLRILSPGMRCYLSYPANTFIVATETDEGADPELTSYPEFPTKAITTCLASHKRICIFSVYGETYIELLVSLYEFAVAMNQALVITPDLSPCFPGKRLREITFEGQTYLGKENIASSTSFNLPVPQGVIAESFLKA